MNHFIAHFMCGVLSALTRPLPSQVSMEGSAGADQWEWPVLPVQLWDPGVVSGHCAGGPLWPLNGWPPAPPDVMLSSFLKQNSCRGRSLSNTELVLSRNTQKAARPPTPPTLQHAVGGQIHWAVNQMQFTADSTVVAVSVNSDAHWCGSCIWLDASNDISDRISGVTLSGHSWLICTYIYLLASCPQLSHQAPHERFAASHRNERELTALSSLPLSVCFYP